jgi:hypothetical protein
LLPIVDDEDPVAELEAGRVPNLPELKLHNGTIYRWNRPIYDTSGGRPHLRIENRLLPAGPTVVDTMANAALFYGLVTVIGSSERPLWSQLSFRAARDNFYEAARTGMSTELYWPSVGTVPVPELVLRHLLPLADSGLEQMGVDSDVRDRLLGIIEQRCITGRNGAAWMIDDFEHRLKASGGDRLAAMKATTRRYQELMHRNEPVHLWPGGGAGD